MTRQQRELKELACRAILGRDQRVALEMFSDAKEKFGKACADHLFTLFELYGAREDFASLEADVERAISGYPPLSSWGERAVTTVTAVVVSGSIILALWLGNWWFIGFIGLFWGALLCRIVFRRENVLLRSGWSLCAAGITLAVLKIPKVELEGRAKDGQGFLARIDSNIDWKVILVLVGIGAVLLIVDRWLADRE